MSSRLPIIHKITDLGDGPFRRQQLDLEFSNGQRRIYERQLSQGHGAVVVVPMLDAQTVLLVREYAAGVHRYELVWSRAASTPAKRPSRPPTASSRKKPAMAHARYRCCAR